MLCSGQKRQLKAEQRDNARKVKLGAVAVYPMLGKAYFDELMRAPACWTTAIKKPAMWQAGFLNGAGRGIRTPNRLLTRQLLYR